MLDGIDISAVGGTTQSQCSAERISLLLESTFLDSAWVKHCTGELVVSRLVEFPDRVTISGLFSGRSNGRDFSIPFERDYLINDDVSLSSWLKSPVVALVLSTFRMLYNEQAPEKKTENWRARSEFEIASILESNINILIGAPIEGVRSIWRKSLISGINFFLLGTIAMSFYAYTHPHPRNNDGPLGRFVISVMVGALFTGLPLSLAGVFLGLSFVGHDVEDSVSGQSLLKLVGVPNARGLRTVSIAGVIVCLGLAVFAARMMVSRG
jgi:hypothetical protein